MKPSIDTDALERMLEMLYDVGDDIVKLIITNGRAKYEDDRGIHTYQCVDAVVVMKCGCRGYMETVGPDLGFEWTYRCRGDRPFRPTSETFDVVNSSKLPF